MNILAVQHGSPLAINMNQPGSPLHWSIFIGVGGESGLTNPAYYVHQQPV